jgi:tripartite-type tricarboxylate transporter receptor subunit TctC
MTAIFRAAPIALAAMLAAAPAGAQNYPDKPIRMIVSIAAGSVTDVIMRAAANELGPRLGQQLVIENKGGASGIPAAQACATSPPDGYTLCVIYHSTLVFNPLLFDKLPYDPDKDFDLITRLFFLIEAVAVNPSLGVGSMAELKAAAQAKPQAFNYGTLGPGSFPELFLKWVNNQWSTGIVAIPYRGGGPIAQALAAGDIQIGNMGLGNFLGLAQGGKLKLLAVSAPKRSALAPDVPTFAEAGIGGYPGRGWWGLAAPKGTPKPILDKLNAEFVKLFSEPKFLAFLEQQAVVSAPGTPSEFATFLKDDREKAESLIKLANTPRTDYKPEQQ